MNTTEFKEFLKEFGLSQNFSLAVSEEVRAIPDLIPDDELARRESLSDKLIITIDGADAKDLDDAVSVERLENGRFLLGVHIADVSHYVKEDTALDDEAYSRGTSVYLVDQVVPMLPKKLSNGLCSLNPHKIRLTLSCFMEISSEGGVSSYRLSESYIKTAHRMTYDKVTAILDGDMAARSEYEALVPMLEDMRALALILRDKRMRRGSLDFDFPEPKLVIGEEGAVAEVVIHKNGIANKIIEEFMLAANETVARHFSKNELSCVYRVHEDPSEEKLEHFVTLVRNMNYPFRMKKEISPKAMQNLLFKIQGTPEQMLISTMMLRSFMKARYSDENLGHFGLAAPFYCHFTSPIRRYPDLMVHRILKASIGGRTDANALARFGIAARNAADQSTDTELAAVEAEREWTAYRLCEYMETQLGQEFDGIISSVTSFGLFIQLPNTVEGLVRMVDLDDDYYEYDEANMILTGRRSGRIYRIGEKMRVRLAKVTKELKQIDFVPADMKPQKKEEKKKHGGKGKKSDQKAGNGKKRRAKQKGKA